MQGLGFRVEGFRVYGLGFICVLWLRVLGLGRWRSVLKFGKGVMRMERAPERKSSGASEAAAELGGEGTMVKDRGGTRRELTNYPGYSKSKD